MKLKVLRVQNVWDDPKETGKVIEIEGRFLPGKALRFVPYRDGFFVYDFEKYPHPPTLLAQLTEKL